MRGLLPLGIGEDRTLNILLWLRSAFYHVGNNQIKKTLGKLLERLLLHHSLYFCTSQSLSYLRVHRMPIHHFGIVFFHDHWRQPCQFGGDPVLFRPWHYHLLWRRKCRWPWSWHLELGGPLVSQFISLSLSFCVCKMGMTTPSCGLKCWDLLKELREGLCAEGLFSSVFSTPGLMFQTQLVAPATGTDDLFHTGAVEESSSSYASG